MRMEDDEWPAVEERVDRVRANVSDSYRREMLGDRVRKEEVGKTR